MEFTKEFSLKIKYAYQLHNRNSFNGFFSTYNVSLERSIEELVKKIYEASNGDFQLISTYQKMYEVFNMTSMEIGYDEITGWLVEEKRKTIQMEILAVGGQVQNLDFLMEMHSVNQINSTASRAYGISFNPLYWSIVTGSATIFVIFYLLRKWRRKSPTLETWKQN